MLSLRNTGKDPSAGLSNIRPGDQNWSDKDFNFFLFFFYNRSTGKNKTAFLLFNLLQQHFFMMLKN